MKILVTGANGQVGSEIVEKAPGSNIDVCGFDRQSLDVTLPEQIEAAITSCQPDIIINCAAYTAVDKAEDEKELAYAINRDGAANLAKACKSHDIPLLHISTDYVFDGKKDTPYTEDDAVNPLSVYGDSKWQGEEAIRNTWSKHIILRTSWVFGKYGHNFVKTMLRLAESHQSLSIVSDQHGSPTAATDIADTLLNIINKLQHGEHHWGAYHYSGTPFSTWADFASEIFRIAAETSNQHYPLVKKITTDEYPAKATRPENSQLDCSLIARVFHIQQPDWITALDPVIKATMTSNGYKT